MIAPVPIERLAERVHDSWLAYRTAQGCTSRMSETGEELMVPYADLSEAAKDLDRCTVQAVLEALGAIPPAATAAMLPAAAMFEDARAFCLARYNYMPDGYVSPEARERHVDNDARSTVLEPRFAMPWSAGYDRGVAEGRRQAASDVRAFAERRRLVMLADRSPERHAVGGAYGLAADVAATGLPPGTDRERALGRLAGQWELVAEQPAPGEQVVCDCNGWRCDLWRDHVRTAEQPEGGDR